MRTISTLQLDALLQNSTPIESDGFGLKVARLSDGNFLKFYRRKRLLSSALWILPSERFASNVQRLKELGVACPDVVELLLIPDRRLNAVLYRPLPGDTLRNHWRRIDAEQRSIEVRQFGAFLAHLHQSGVYFRSLHLGNVLRLPDGTLGLIDLSDMKVGSHPLNAGKRKRNIQHILRYPEDTAWLTQQHRQDWLAGYAQNCSSRHAMSFERALNKAYPTLP